MHFRWVRHMTPALVSSTDLYSDDTNVTYVRDTTRTCPWSARITRQDGSGAVGTGETRKRVQRWAEGEVGASA